MTEFGMTPHLSATKFEKLGYNLVIYPVTMQRVAMGAITSCLQKLFEDGSAEGFEHQMQTRQELYELLGYVPGEAMDVPQKLMSRYETPPGTPK